MTGQVRVVGPLGGPGPGPLTGVLAVIRRDWSDHRLFRMPFVLDLIFGTINLGVIADLAGPVPGLFAGAVAGAQAYVAKVNSEGGLFGRKLKLDVHDSQMDCGQYQAATSSVVSSSRSGTVTPS